MGVGGPPGLLLLPRTLLAGWACCPAEGVLKHRSVPPFLGQGGPDTDLGGGLGEGVVPFHLAMVAPLQASLKDVCGQWFGLLLTPTYSGTIFSRDPPPTHLMPTLVHRPQPHSREHRRVSPEFPPAPTRGADWREGLSPSVVFWLQCMACVTSVSRPGTEAGPQQ